MWTSIQSKLMIFNIINWNSHLCQWRTRSPHFKSNENTWRRKIFQFFFPLLFKCLFSYNNITIWVLKSYFLWLFEVIRKRFWSRLFPNDINTNGRQKWRPLGNSRERENKEREREREGEGERERERAIEILNKELLSIQTLHSICISRFSDAQT
jgi:hypothetical protein